MWLKIKPAGSWGWDGIKLSGQVDSSPLQYVQPLPLNRRCLPHWLAFAAKDDLERDPLLRGRFILLARVDGHASWVSNAVLSTLNNLPDEVDGGLIIRDKAGKPTGLSDSPLTDCMLPTL